MVNISDDVWFFGSLIMANTSETWWISLIWLGVASWVAVSNLVGLRSDK